jgi:hypothetical protein
MPAKMESDNLEPRMVAASKVTTPAVTGVITDSASTDVAVLRELGLSAVPYALSQRNPNPEGGLRRLSQRTPNPEARARRLSQRDPNPKAGVRRSPSSAHAARLSADKFR